MARNKLTPLNKTALKLVRNAIVEINSNCLAMEAYSEAFDEADESGELREAIEQMTSDSQDLLDAVDAVLKSR